MFKKRVEDFVCEHCAFFVKGNGFTNHCPKCLWGKHVDIEPGDRAEDCGGLMEPIKAEVEKGEYILTHKCIKCHKEKRNRISKDDDFDTVVMVVKKRNEKFMNRNK